MFGENDRLLTWYVFPFKSIPFHSSMCILLICRIGRQFGIYPWLININGGTSLKQPVWIGDVAAAIRKYCMEPEKFAGKTMELAGPEIMQWAQIVEWFKEVTHTKKDLPRTPTSIARLYAGLLEFGPKPYISRSDVDLRATDNILDVHTECITFKDLGVRDLSN